MLLLFWCQLWKVRPLPIQAEAHHCRNSPWKERQLWRVWLFLAIMFSESFSWEVMSVSANQLQGLFHTSVHWRSVLTLFSNLMTSLDTCFKISHFPPNCFSNGSWTVLLKYLFIFKLFLSWNTYFLVGTWKLYMLQKNDDVVPYFTFYNYRGIGQSGENPFDNQSGSLIKLLWFLKRLELIHKAWWLFWHQHYFMNRSTSFIFLLKADSFSITRT